MNTKDMYLDEETVSSDVSPKDENTITDYMTSADFGRDVERFDEMISRDSRSVVTSLRAMNKNQDIVQLALLWPLSFFIVKTAALEREAPPRQIHVFYQTGLPSLFLDLLADRETYQMGPKFQVSNPASAVVLLMNSS